MMTQLLHPMAASDLNQLCDILNAWAEAIAYRDALEDPSDYPCDMSSLPTFGGDDIEDTTEIYSWDESRVLVPGREIAVGHSGWMLIPRDNT